MNEKNRDCHGDANSKSANEENYKLYHIFVKAVRSLQIGSYTPNFFIGAAFLLITPFLGLVFMKTLQGILFAFGLGVTLLFWIFWIAVLRAVPKQDQRPAPAVVQQPSPQPPLNPSHPFIGPHDDPIPPVTDTVKPPQSATINNTNQSGGSNTGIENK